MINKIATKISGIDIDKDYYYDLILEYRKNIVDKKFYYILNEYKRFKSEYFKGNIPFEIFLKVDKKCSELYSEFSLYNGSLSIYYIDLKMPDNGPYSDQYADQYCLHKFKDWRKECRLAIKQYYKEKDDK